MCVPLGQEPALLSLGSTACSSAAGTVDGRDYALKTYDKNTMDERVLATAWISKCDDSGTKTSLGQFSSGDSKNSFLLCVRLPTKVESETKVTSVTTIRLAASGIFVAQWCPFGERVPFKLNQTKRLPSFPHHGHWVSEDLLVPSVGFLNSSNLFAELDGVFVISSLSKFDQTQQLRQSIFRGMPSWMTLFGISISICEFAGEWFLLLG